MPNDALKQLIFSALSGWIEKDALYDGLSRFLDFRVDESNVHVLKDGLIIYSSTWSAIMLPRENEWFKLVMSEDDASWILANPKSLVKLNWLDIWHGYLERHPTSVLTSLGPIAVD